MRKDIHAVGILFENALGEILILRRRDDSVEGGTWGLPGGTIDGNETPVAAAIRETSEEIGFAVAPSSLRSLQSYRWTRKGIELSFDVFKSADIPEEIAFRDEEHTASEWVLPKDAYKRDNLMKGLYPILEDEYGLSQSPS